MPVLYPVHPRTKNFIEQYGLKLSKNIRVIPPLGYLQMLAAEKNAAVILTDSGGVQKEAFFHHVPCVTMRRETEWIETVEAGWNILAGANPEKIKNAVRMFIDSPPLQAGISPYGEGNASDLILKSILEETGNV
jgi:UDP-GlcNAc3NAcA epimerase